MGKSFFFIGKEGNFFGPFLDHEIDFGKTSAEFLELHWTIVKHSSLTTRSGKQASMSSKLAELI